MGFNFTFISLILLVNIEDILTLERLHVNCEHKNNCALRETEVTLRCVYLKGDIKTGFWFSHKQSENWRESDEPEDIALDFDYSGRVKQQITNYQSALTIRDVRERDSGEYQLMFIMKDGVKHISSVTVHLTVTVLQVKVHEQSTEERDQTVLTCETSCTLSPNPGYAYWKKDGQYIQHVYTERLSVSSSEYAAYFCLTPDHKISSAPVCLSDRCWHVTYTSRRVCALVGSTVEIHSSYSHPTGYTVVNTYWHSRPERVIDIREEQQFAGRVEYVGNTLRIKDVNMSDSGEYQFRIITNTSDGKYSGSPGVNLTVTDTQVTISPVVVSDGEKVILSCSTKCTLDKSMTFSWYKNGQPVTDGFTLLNKLYLDSVNKDELKEYSCTVTEEPVKSLVPDFLIVFVVQVLIIGAVWVWFFLKIFFLSKYQINDKNEEIQVSHMSACTSAVSSTELVA
ncbi:uncharacterized protein LOC130548979 isoform X2 [Triplophysa rosa]|uniref:uncharacterized protein LOC130548979 isoform X2 n=1 Tax=Triplophysa rosa TaxID=992332 RepID=UPI0025462155|nr:uncharacterized protein LOC130548979 isoform X2 [Triplophysa rosa]